jgi:hypothetical protein
MKTQIKLVFNIIKHLQKINDRFTVQSLSYFTDLLIY